MFHGSYTSVAVQRVRELLLKFLAARNICHFYLIFLMRLSFTIKFYLYTNLPRKHTRFHKNENFEQTSVADTGCISLVN